MTDLWLLPGAVKDEQSMTAEWTSTTRPVIDGVHVREVRHVIGASGYLTEIYRADWGLDPAAVDQVFELTLGPGSVSAWHAHGDTRDRLFVADGTARIVLYDSRPGSPTRGVVGEYRTGVLRPMLIVVPPRVWHGVQAIGTVPARIVNIVDKQYEYADPDHSRLPHDTTEIPFRFPSS
jgi:dTDP-4-dehydrorhamnose 3,5-epimerase